MKQINFVALSLLFLSISCHKPDTADLSGSLWQKLNTPYFGRISDIQFTSSDTGYIIGYDTTVPVSTTIIKTFDGGKTWQKIYFPHVVANANSLQPAGGWLQVSPFDSNILFSMAGGINIVYIIRSADGGYHWNIIDSTPSHAAWGRYHFFSPANILRSGEFIYTSTDSGFTWSKVYDPKNGFADFEMLQFPDIQTGFTAGGIAYDATNYGVMAKTTDGGNTWQKVNYPFHTIIGMSFINDNTGYVIMDMDSGNTARTYAGGCDLYKTENGGNTWQIVNKNIFSNYYYDYAADLYFKSEQEGFVLGGVGSIYHTTNGGRTWRNELPSSGIMNLAFPSTTCAYAIDKKGNVYKRIF